MLLTDKAKEDFIKWSKKQIDLQIGVQIPNTMGGTIFHLNSNIEILPKRILNFLIIEWFDSVDIAIHTYDLKNKNFLKLYIHLYLIYLLNFPFYFILIA